MLKLLIYSYILILSISLLLAEKDDLELPLCPINIQYLPQELPMHCRMPKIATSNIFKLPDFIDTSSGKLEKRQASKMSNLSPPPEYPYFQSPSPDKLPIPMPFPVPPFPGISLGGLGQLHPNMAVPVPGSIPGMPGSIPVLPGAMPLPIQGSSPHKMPVIVMPFYSPDRKSFTRSPHHDKNIRNRKSHRHDSFEVDLNSEEFDDTSEYNRSSDDGLWQSSKKRIKKGHKNYGIYRRYNKYIRRKKKKKDLLTPILQYVTKDGYVIFEKKITNNEAIDWLGPKDSTVSNTITKAKGIVKNDGQENTQYKNLETKEVEKLETDMAHSGKDDVNIMNNKGSFQVKDFSIQNNSEESKEVIASPTRIKIKSKNKKRKSNVFI